jgi:Holliday junction resolvase RusA-like endonuclease
MDWKKDFGFLVGDMGPFHGPISIKADFHFASPSKSWGPHTSSQDVDNLLKSVMDALQDCDVIQDDKMVYSATGQKFWSYENKIILSIYT